MWLTASVFYAYQYILRVMPSVMLDDLMGQFGMNATAFGQFSGVYYIGYSLAHIPLGIMLDKYGPRKVIPLCAALSVVGTLPIIFSESCACSIIGRAVTGIGSSAAILGLFKIIRMAFDERRFARMLSFSVTIGLAGAIYGGAPLAYMREVFAYRSVVGILAIAGVVLAFAAYAIIPETEGKSDDSSTLSSLREVLLNPKVAITCVSAGLMVGPLEGFADIWGPKFLKQVYGVETSAASSLTSMIFIGMCFGSPVLNFIAEKMNDYIKAVIFSGIAMLAVFAALIAGYLNTLGITIGFIVVGVCSAYQILAIYKASTYVAENSAGLTTALANMIIMTFGYVIHSSIGAVIEKCAPLGETAAFRCGIATIPVALLMGVIGFIAVSRMEKFDEK
jgi:predicted MFS family arabinose efflux permease